MDFSRKPAVLFVNHLIDVYLNIPPKFVEALALCRLAPGNNDELDVDAGVIQARVNLIGTDGLTYCPTDIFDTVPMGLAHFAEGESDEMTPFAEIWGEGRQIVTTSILAQVDDNPQWIEIWQTQSRSHFIPDKREGQFQVSLESSIPSRTKSSQQCR